MRSGKIHEKAVSTGRFAGRDKKDIGRRLLKVYNILLERFGPRGWWPTSKKGLEPKYRNNPVSTEKDRFEVCAGAILTQNSAWDNAKRAIINLNSKKLMSPEALFKVRLSELSRAIKPSGYFRQKAIKLKKFSKHRLNNYASFKEWFKKPADELRKEFLGIYGIGPETADSILLYAARKPYFIADAYTIRVFSRLGFGNFKKYGETSRFFRENLEPGVRLFQEYHALIVELGKNYCGKRKPLCDECPLEKICLKKIR